MSSDPGVIRVAHVITKLAVGGAQETVLTTCRGLPSDRFAQVIISGTETDEEGSLWGAERLTGIETVRVVELSRKISPIQDLRALLKIVGLLRSLRPDIVHTHSSKAGVLGRLAGRWARVPVVVHTVHGWSFHDEMSPLARGVIARIERVVARWTDALVVVSSTDVSKGLSHRIGRAQQYSLIRSGIDIERFRNPHLSRAAARAELEVPEDVFVVGTVGRLADQKDPFTMLEAWARVAQADPLAVFLWVGDGPLRRAAEQRCRELGVSASFRFLGVRADVSAVLPGLDCFALSSRWEGLPRTLTEAMASGLPAVATAVDGTVEAIDDGSDGFLVPSGDAAALADAVLRLRSDPSLRRAVGAAAKASAQRFSQARMLERVDALYEALHSGRPAVPGERPLKLVHVISGLGFGGAERQLQALVTNSDPRVVEHEVVSLTALGPIGAEMQAAGVKVSALGLRRSWPDPRLLYRLRRQLAGSGADVVQTWLYHGDLLGGIVARSLRIPVIWSVRMTWMDPSFARASTYRIATLCARLSRVVPSIIVFNSERARSTHIDHGYATEQAVVIPNGLDDTRFRPDPHAGTRLRVELGLDERTRLIGAIGRFDPQKAHDVLIEAVGHVATPDQSVHLLLAGPGCDTTNHDLTEQIARHGLSDRASLLGPLTDVAPVMAGLDLLVSASRYGESFPNVIAEALACSVPVVATDVADVGAVLPPSHVVEPGDPVALAGAIREALNNDAPSAASPPRIGHQDMAKRYLELYESLVR